MRHPFSRPHVAHKALPTPYLQENQLNSITRRHFCQTSGLLLLGAFAGTGLTACGNGTNSATTPQVFAALRGTQERPTQVATAATGAATVTQNTNSLGVDITTQNLAGVTAVDIRVGKPGTNGPVIFTLYTAANNGSLPSSFHKDLSASDLQAQSSAGISTFSDAVNAIVTAGNTYINISTQANPTGELRGQIGAASFQVTPTGTAVVPSVTTNATATANVQLNSKQSVLAVTVGNTANLSNVRHIGLYYAPLGGNGPELFTVFDSNADGVFPGSVTRTFTTTDLVKQTGSGIATYADAVNALLSGNTYLLITTTAHSGGELRAQLIAQ